MSLQDIKYLKIKDGTYKFYLLNESFILYRGDTDQYLKHKTLRNDFEYFAIDKDTANFYGLVSKYNPTKNLILFAMDDLNNIKYLYNSVPSDNITLRNDISNSFGYNTLIRHSDVKSDKNILQYICSLGMDGYASNKIKTHSTDQQFHAEIAICNPLKNVAFNSNLEYDEEYIKKAIKDSKLVKLSYDLKEKRKINYLKDDDDDDDESTYTPKKLIF